MTKQQANPVVQEEPVLTEEEANEKLFAEEVARRAGVKVDDLVPVVEASSAVEDLDLSQAAPEGTPPEGTPPEGAAPEGTPPKGAAPEGAAPEGAAPEGVTQQVVEEGMPAWYAEASDEVKASFDAINQNLTDTREQYTALHGRLAPMQQANERLRGQVEHAGQRPSAQAPDSSAPSSQQPGQTMPGAPPTPVLDLGDVPEFAEFREAFPDQAKAMQALFGRQAQHAADLQRQLGNVSQGLERIQQASFGKERQDGLRRLSEAHPDYMNIHPSEDFGQWLQTQPPNVAQMANSVNAEECIWILDRYKQDVWAQRQLDTPSTPAPTSPSPAITTVRRRRQNLRSVPGVDPAGSTVGVPLGNPEVAMSNEDSWFEEVERRLRLEREQRQ